MTTSAGDTRLTRSPRGRGLGSLLRRAVAVAVVATVTGGCDRPRESAGRTPALVISDRATPVARPPGRALDLPFRLAGDYVHARFSPDQRFLALAEVVLVDSMEASHLLLIDVDSGWIDTLLKATAAVSYGTYAATVVRIAWRTSDTVSYLIHDGDVDATDLAFHVPTRGFLGAAPLGPDDDAEEPQLPDSLQQIVGRLTTLYPAFSRSAFESALQLGPAPSIDSAIILQFAYAGQDNSVRRFDLRRADEAVLVAVDSGRGGIRAFGGAMAAGGVTILAVRHDAVAHVYSVRGGSPPTSALAVPADLQSPALHTRYRDDARAIALVQTHHPHERGHNPVLLVDSEGVRAWAGPDSLFDLDVSRGLRYVAFIHWVGGRRHLTVARPDSFP